MVLITFSDAIDWIMGLSLELISRKHIYVFIHYIIYDITLHLLLQLGLFDVNIDVRYLISIVSLMLLSTEFCKYDGPQRT